MAVVSLGGGVLAAAPAAADSPYDQPMPEGNWTFVRDDGYLHYACKIPTSSSVYGPLYKVRTATWLNGEHEAVRAGIGVYAVISRFDDSNIINTVTNQGWLYGFNGNEMWASAWYSDRLWIQAAAYGPVTPWTDGVAVKDLVDC